MYAEFNGDGLRPNEVQNAAQGKRFQGETFRVWKGYNQEARCLENIKIELGNDKRLKEKVVISAEKVTKQCRMMPNWKVPGTDDIQDYWIKNLTNLHDRIAVQADKISIRVDSLPAWMTNGRTALCQRDFQQKFQ